MLLKVLLPLLFLLPAHAKFSRGSNYDYVALEGNLSIKCPDRKVVVECRDTFMEPWPYDIFTGPRVPGANTIEIRAENKNNVQSTVADYDGETGHSSEINLGVYSLFQKPLLRPGLNKLHYAITNRESRIQTTGKFEVYVGRLHTRRCESRETTRYTNEDCFYTYTVCQQYFKSQDYCR